MNPEAGSPTPDGKPRSYWATPWELRWRPWALDFAADNEGRTSFPLEYIINPYPHQMGDPVPVEHITDEPNPTVTTLAAHGLTDGTRTLVSLAITDGTMGGVLNSRPWPVEVLSGTQLQIQHPIADTTGRTFVAGNVTFGEDFGAFEWRLENWDPALRFWVVDYDQHLTEWLKTTDVSRSSIMAAREFGSQYQKWHPSHVNFRETEADPLGWIKETDLKWWPYSGASNPVFDPSQVYDAWLSLRGELEQLKFYMEDDRELYVYEAEAQADGIHAYYAHFISADAYDRPWTLELIDTALAMGSLAYLAYKAHFNRVRPTFLRPGLIAPFGPPEHPAYPSGHAFLAHFIALLLLEIPELHQRMGVFGDTPFDGQLGRKPTRADLDGEDVVESPMLRIAHRIAVNRERIGVHYPSDTFCGRHLAAGIWEALMPQDDGSIGIPCPSLLRTLELAKAEWADLTKT